MFLMEFVVALQCYKQIQQNIEDKNKRLSQVTLRTKLGATICLDLRSHSALIKHHCVKL